MKLRPLHDRIVVERTETEEKTQSGIVLPGSAAEKPETGKVIAVGPGAVSDNGAIRELSVKVGDTVLFGKYSGQTIKVNGDELLVMSEKDIFAVIED
jgi:chaperonin GroES